jgi:hypothetical protein
MPFEKGTFGNLGGRPKALAEVVELARSHTAGAIATLAEVATDSVVVLLDYGWVGPRTTRCSRKASR